MAPKPDEMEARLKALEALLSRMHQGPPAPAAPSVTHVHIHMPEPPMPDEAQKGPMPASHRPSPHPYVS